MYSTEYEPTLNEWNIFDPDGDYIASVQSVQEAEALLSHLNRSS